MKTDITNKMRGLIFVLLLLTVMSSGYLVMVCYCEYVAQYYIKCVKLLTCMFMCVYDCL